MNFEISKEHKAGIEKCKIESERIKKLTLLHSQLVERRTAAKLELNRATYDGLDTDGLANEVTKLDKKIEAAVQAMNQASSAYANLSRFEKITKEAERAKQRIQNFKAVVVPELLADFEAYLQKDFESKVRAHESLCYPAEPAELPRGLSGQIIAAIEGRNPDGSKKIIG